MRLAYRCPNSKVTLLLKEKASDRSELARIFPQGISVECPQCGLQHVALPNEIFAVEDKVLSIVGGVGVLCSFLAGGVFIYLNWTNVLSIDLYVLVVLLGILAIPPLITNTLVVSERKAISNFNGYHL